MLDGTTERYWGAVRTLQTGDKTLDLLELLWSVTKHSVVSTFKFQGIKGTEGAPV